MNPPAPPANSPFLDGIAKALRALTTPAGLAATALTGLSSPLSLGAKAVSNVAGLFSGLGGAAGLAATGVKGVAGAVAGIAAPLGQVSKAVLGTVSALTGALQSNVAAYTRLFNPAATKLLDLAINDLNASIGEALMPVLRMGISAVRSLADVFAGMGPQAKQLLAALVAAGVGAAVTAAMVTGLSLAFNSATAGIPILIGAIVAGAAAFLAVGAPITGATKVFQDFANQGAKVMDFLGEAASQVADAMMPLVQVLLDMLGSGVGTLPTLLKPLIDAVETTVKSLAPILAQLLPPLFALTGVMQYFGMTIIRVLAEIGAVIMGVLSPVFAVLAISLKLLATGLAIVVGAFNLVIDVFQAVRRTFESVIGGITGDVMNILQPAFDELSGAFSAVKEFVLDAAATVKETFGEIVTDIREALQPVVDFVRSVIHAIFDPVADAIRRVARAIRSAVDQIREFFGIEKRPEDKTDVGGKSDGKAVTNVQTSGVEDSLRKQREFAFGAGRGEDPAKATAKNTATATNHLGKLADFFSGSGFEAAIYKGVKKVIDEVRNVGVDAVRGTAENVLNNTVPGMLVREGLRQLS